LEKKFEKKAVIVSGERSRERQIVFEDGKNGKNPKKEIFKKNIHAGVAEPGQ